MSNPTKRINNLIKNISLLCKDFNEKTANMQRNLTESDNFGKC